MSEKTQLNSKIEEKPNTIFIGTYNEVESYFKDNEYIRKGYLLNANTNFRALKSLFILNNETVNVWSHLLGALFVIFLVMYTAIFITNYNTQISIIKSNIYELKETMSHNMESLCKYNNMTSIKNLVKIVSEAQWNFTSFDINKIYKDSYYSLNYAYDQFITSTQEHIYNLTDGFVEIIERLRKKFTHLREKLLDMIEFESITFGIKEPVNSSFKLKRWPLFIFLVSAILCLSFSTTFHLIGKVSQKHHQILSRFDYAGIALLISGSCYSPYYYFFHCETFIRYAYLIFITIFGVVVFFYSLTSGFHLPQNRPFRGILYIIFGLSAGIPVIHISFFGKNIKGFVEGLNYQNWIYGGVSYIVGAIFYILRFPERIFPGKVDYFGASHQIFHCFVLGGVVFHYFGCLDAYYFRFDNVCVA